jgi:hypothetical protein
MRGLLLYDLFIVVAWVGLWGGIESLIDKIAKDDANIRFIVYVLISIVAIFAIWIIDSIDGDPPE